MTVNIPIAQREIVGELVQTFDGRDLHADLGVSKDYTNWAKAQIKRARLVENKDFVVFAQKGVNPAGGRPATEYHFTLEAGKHIGMMSGTARGSEVREYFLACERQAKAAAPAVKDPQIAAVIFTLTRIDAMEQEQKRQAEELAKLAENVAVIEARTQPENKHFTVAGYANLIGIPMDNKTAANLGRRCAALSRQRGLVIGDVSDPRFGNVHSYHESVLQEVVTPVAKAA